MEKQDDCSIIIQFINKNGLEIGDILEHIIYGVRYIVIKMTFQFILVKLDNNSFKEIYASELENFKKINQQSSRK